MNFVDEGVFEKAFAGIRDSRIAISVSFPYKLFDIYSTT